MLDTLKDLDKESPGAWHTRRNLAVALDTTGLNPSRKEALKSLAEYGLIEAKHLNGDARNIWRYRIIQ